MADRTRRGVVELTPSQKVVREGFKPATMTVDIDGKEYTFVAAAADAFCEGAIWWVYGIEESDAETTE